MTAAASRDHVTYRTRGCRVDRRQTTFRIDSSPTAPPYPVERPASPAAFGGDAAIADASRRPCRSGCYDCPPPEAARPMIGHR